VPVLQQGICEITGSFTSCFLTYLPSKEQLKAEVEKQKAVFYAQHPDQAIENTKDDEKVD
jgi:hypothetical protein